MRLPPTHLPRSPRLLVPGPLWRVARVGALCAAVVVASAAAAQDAPRQTERLRDASIAHLESVFGARSGARWTVRHQGHAYDVGFAFGWREPETERGLAIVAAAGAAQDASKGRYTEGFVQLFMLRDEGERLVEIARSQPIIAGAMGEPPRIDGVLAVGPGDRRAVLMSVRQSWQGQTRADYLLYGLRGGDERTLRAIGSFATHAGSCGQGMRPAECWTAQVAFDTTPSASTCWPIVLTRTQRSGTGRETSRSSARATCRADGTYITPPAYNGPFF